MSVREQVNRMLFGGQHEAIIEWIENLKKELERISMPENRYYTVTQEREVKVTASNPLEAGEFAQHVFDGKDLEGEIKSRIRTPIRDRDLVVREDY